MSQEAKIGLIFEAINKVMSEIGSIGKDRKNQMQGYSFRGIDDVYNAVQPALVKHGVFILPEVIDQKREERTNTKGTTLLYTILTVRHRFCALDGSSVACVTVGEAMDSGDKSANKAMSAAMKYAVIETFCIPTEGDNDTENHSHEVKPKAAAKPAPAPSPAPAATPAAMPAKNREMVYHNYDETKRFVVRKDLVAAAADINYDTCPWGKSKGKKWDALEVNSLKGLWGVAHDIILNPIEDATRKANAVAVLQAIQKELVIRDHTPHVEFENPNQETLPI